MRWMLTLERHASRACHGAESMRSVLAHGPGSRVCFFLAGRQRTEDFQQCNSTSLEISMRNKVIIIAGFVFACGATIAPSFAADSPATKEITAADLAKSKPTATFEIEGKQLRLLVGGATG